MIGLPYAIGFCVRADEAQRFGGAGKLDTEFRARIDAPRHADWVRPSGERK